MNKPPHRDELRGIKYETLREPGMSIMEQGGGVGEGGRTCVFFLSFLSRPSCSFTRPNPLCSHIQVGGSECETDEFFQWRPKAHALQLQKLWFFVGLPKLALGRPWVRDCAGPRLALRFRTKLSLARFEPRWRRAFLNSEAITSSLWTKFPIGWSALFAWRL